MWNLYDIAYGIGLGISAPYWGIKPSARKKVLGAFQERTATDLQQRQGDKPALLLHAVSVGEMNATPMLIDMLRKMRPDLEFYVSATTETGFAGGQELY